MNTELKNKLLAYLMTFITDERKNKFDDILKWRTRHITVVIEDIYQPHNASAVLRTCDLTGVQDVHIIENRNEYVINNEVAMGSSKWLNIIKYNQEKNNTKSALNDLKKKGYKIIATTPHKRSYDLNSLPLDDKIALVFGTELTGLSDIAIENSDEYLQIPMYGFTESFNISVSAALCLYTLSQRLRNSDIQWKLNENEITDILLDWARNSIKKPELLEKEFIKLNS